jgi:Amt family ammonium transporter
MSSVLGFVIAIVMQKTMGIRVSKKEEVEGLDIHEHKTSSYPNFTISPTQQSE